MTCKILAPTDALGNLVRFLLTLGQRHGSVEVPPLIKGVAFDGLIVNRPSTATLSSPNWTTVATRSSSRKTLGGHKIKIGAAIYAWRHLIKNLFCNLKKFKRIAMRA